MDLEKVKYQVNGVLLIAVAALLLGASNCSSTVINCKFPAIFNFGDSNSDTGGLSAAFGQAPPPNGETFFHHPAGRFSDGRLVIDFIAESLGLPYLSAYLDAVGSNFSHGSNFATAGSTIRSQNTTLSQSGFSPISLNIQFTQFSDFQTRSQFIRNQGGVYELLLPNEKAFSKALYTFDIGQNDLVAGYKLNLSIDQVKSYVPDLLFQLSKVIKNVYAKGGRSFWIHNTGPVGCLPYVMDQFPITAAQIDEHGCARPYNEVAHFFNIKLYEKVVELRKILPLAFITYVDVYSIKYTLISNAHKLGFEDPFKVCCGHGGKFNYNGLRFCGSKKYVNGTEIVVAKSCKNPNSRIIWDGVHFTEAANKWIFDRFVNGSFSDPPVGLNLACHNKSFEEPLRACCGQGGKHNYSGKFGCGKKINKDGKEIIMVNACKNTSTAINWDGIHFTEAANKWVFDQIVINSSYSHPPIPLPLHLACYINTPKSR